MESTYLIASKVFKIIYGNDPASECLADELSLYAKAPEGAEADVVVSVNSKHPEGILTRNPSIHGTIENGFIVDFGSCSVSWQVRDAVHINILFDKPKSHKSKWKNWQFQHPCEDIGQHFHELILIPTIIFFIKDVAPVHSSAVGIGDNKVLLFGGTGGVGKTSLLLECALNKGFAFGADDFCFLDSSGSVWPNFAYPKIYGYNTVGNPALIKKIFSNRSMLDRLQWKYKFKKRGAKKVRRRVRPTLFFPSVLNGDNRLHSFWILNRKKHDSLDAKILSIVDVVQMNWNIIQAEYSLVLRHAWWHELNAKLLNVKPIVTYDQIKESYITTLTNSLKKAELLSIGLPISRSLISFDEIDKFVKSK